MKGKAFHKVIPVNFVALRVTLEERRRMVLLHCRLRRLKPATKQDQDHGRAE